MTTSEVIESLGGKATLISGFFVGVRLVLTSRLVLAMQLHSQAQHTQTLLTLG
jgi:hypothetical protein